MMSDPWCLLCRVVAMSTMWQTRSSTNWLKWSRRRKRKVASHWSSHSRSVGGHLGLINASGAKIVNILEELGQCRECWWPGDLCRQGISSHGIYAELPTSTQFPYFVRILHVKYGSTNLAYKIQKLSSVSCHLRYCYQNKAYLFWVVNQSRFVVFYALKPSNTSLITKTFIFLSSTRGSNMLLNFLFR